jgi:CHAT domain-containing protein
LHTLDMSTAPPASAADIRAALRTAGADALIYLVPSSQYQPGAAVVVPVESEPATLILPGLTTDSGSAFRAGTAKARDAGPVPGEDAGAGARSEGPEDLCRWAWRSGMEPVLRHLGLDRPARLVLVPTGALSTVPWHAAFATSGGERRYAVEDAVISYAISARAFAESASRPRRDIKSVLIVGDPTAELPFAGLEARAVNHAFYPGGTWLGDTDGTPGKVLDWVAAAAPGPSLLHLACHGFADPAHPADACLRLAGGDLTARALLEASRTARLEIEQVFLAACTTGAEGADHDEMFSLSTAFLAAGARTVFGSLWAVPDEATSLLMFMVHHFLVVDRRPPVDALREAQLWMLDPKREAPAEMPRELARHASDPEAADPRSWAAFTHRGR